MNNTKVYKINHDALDKSHCPILSVVDSSVL